MAPYRKIEYRKPQSYRITRGTTSEALYRFEHQLHTFIERKLAPERRKFAPFHGDGSFYHDMLPQLLFDLLDSYDTQAVRLAVSTWLEAQE